MKVKIDEDRCVGCGSCEAICPEVFEVGDDGYAHVLRDDCAAFADGVHEAAEECPQEAIQVDDE